MTREQYKKAFRKSRIQTKKQNNREMYVQKTTLLETIKIECGLVASRQFEAGQMELVAQHEKDNAELKAAGVI